MTTPYERTSAVLQTRPLLEELVAGAASSNVGLVSAEARRLLRHYPNLGDLRMTADAFPMWWGRPGGASFQPWDDVEHLLLGKLRAGHQQYKALKELASAARALQAGALPDATGASSESEAELQYFVRLAHAAGKQFVVSLVDIQKPAEAVELLRL